MNIKTTKKGFKMINQAVAFFEKIEKMIELFYLKREVECDLSWNTY